MADPEGGDRLADAAVGGSDLLCRFGGIGDGRSGQGRDHPVAVVLTLWLDEGRSELVLARARRLERAAQIAHAAAHVFTVKRFFMMSEVRRVEIFIRYPRPESLVASLRYFPMAVQHKAMRKVFRQHPKHDAEGNEGQRAQKMIERTANISRIIV